jgi:phenylpyruvate tautomerase PptA (4-oxalocrotonate tautomerase family)
MPSIDVHAAAGLFSEQDEQVLAEELAAAALRAEGLEPTPFLLGMSWVFFHRYPAPAIRSGTGSIAAGAVRVQVLTPHGRLDPQARENLIREVSDIVARVMDDPAQIERTFVLINETAASGWGLAGLTGSRLVEWATRGRREDGEAGPTN